MCKLIKANLSRLWHDRAFWLLTALNAIIGASMAVINAVNIKKEGSVWVMDFSLLMFAVLAPICNSVLTALFVGNEYSSGTMRNKIVAGHRRGEIYLANLLACCCAGAVFCLAFAIALALPGLLLGGLIQSEPRELLMYCGTGIVLTIAFSALFNLIAMLCQNKSHTVAGCILLTFVLIFFGVYITSSLNEPEYLAGYSYTENGVTVDEPETKNPNYVSGTKRQVYEFLQDFTPGGQALQVSDMSAENPSMLALYDVIIILAATGFGMAFFGKKNLK